MYLKVVEMSDLVIDDTNFSEYFRDASKNAPKPGEVLAIYQAVAELGYGDLKIQLVNTLLSEKIGAQKAIQILIKTGHTSYREAVRVIKSICADLLSGMQKDFVLKKSYKYVLEMQFYTKPEYVPTENQHWQVVGLKNFAVKTA